MLLFEQLYRYLCVLGQVNVIAILQRIAKSFALRFLVIDYEQGWCQCWNSVAYGKFPHLQ